MTLFMRYLSRACLGSRCSTSSATRTPNSSSAPSSPRCAWSARYTRAGPSALEFVKVARAGWRRMASPGPPCWTAPSSRRTTTCASPPSPSGRATRRKATVEALHARIEAVVRELLVVNMSLLRTSLTTFVGRILW